MVDITHKKVTLREATASAVVRVSREQTIQAIEEKKVPKGDVFEMSRAAGLLAVKKTPEMLPDCHPLPIEYTGINYEIKGLEIHIQCTLKTIYKTGVEVEAMHGASVVALNLYDMLKPLDKGIEIEKIKLLEKKGGKSDTHTLKTKVKAAKRAGQNTTIQAPSPYRAYTFVLNAKEMSRFSRTCQEWPCSASCR